MAGSQVEMGGTINADGTLALDHPPNLPPGRVRVLLTPETGPGGKDTLTVLKEIWAQNDALGLQGRTGEEIDEYLRGLRGEWAERERRLDEAHGGA